MSLPAFAVRNHLLILLVSLFVLVAGGVAIFQMKRDAFPEISFDIVRIETAYPGATPEEVEKLITRPIEEKVKGVSEIEEMFSTSTEGFSVIVILIDPDARDPSKVVTEIQQAVDRVDDLPADLEEKPVAIEVKTKDAPIIEVALSGPLQRKELQGLSEELEKELEAFPEVARVDRRGWRDDEIWVELDSLLLARYRVSVDEVVRALRYRNVNVPGGEIDDGKREFLLRTDAQFRTPEEIALVPVRANETGKIVRIRDVGAAKWSFKEPANLLRVDGREAVSLVVVKKLRSDVIRLVEKVEAKVDEFQSRSPKDLKISLVNDLSFFVKRRLGILLNNAWTGLLFALIIQFIFLNRRVAFWATAGLPLGFAMTIGFMSLLDISINLISMFAMIMVLEILVDDSIIVAENIYRHMERGLPAREAAIRGTEEVIKPVCVMVLCTAVAFLPLASMTGIFGKFIWQIPVVAIVTLIASLIESLLFLPTHLAKFSGKPPRIRDENSYRDVLTRFYARTLGSILKVHYIATPVSLVVLAVGIFTAFKVMPINLFPSKGIEIFFVRAEAPVGTSLEESDRRMKGVEKLIAALPPDELKNYVTTTGIVQQDPHDPFTARGSHVSQIAVYLTPEGSRSRTAEEIIDSIRPRLKDVEGFTRVYVDLIAAGPPKGKAVAVRVRGPDFDVARKISARIQEALSVMPGVLDIKEDYELGKEENRVRLRHDEIAMSDLSAAKVAQTVRAAYAGEIATSIREGEREIDVLVRLNEKERASPAAISNLLVENPGKFLVPMARLTTFEKDRGLSAIQHYEAKRVVSVTANVDESVTTSFEVNQKLEKKFAGISKEFFGYDLIFSGENKDTEESLGALKKAMFLSLLIILLILVSAFRSLSQVIIVMLAIPYSLLSALIILKLHGEPLSFLAFLGLIALSGVTVNDSIILMEFMNRAREEGKKGTEAIVEACRGRLRPVLITSLVTLLGLGPMTYGLQGFDPFIRPMVLTIAWGLTFGTILTLGMIPCAYVTMERILYRLNFSRARKAYD